MLIPPILHLYRLRRQEWLQTESLRELQRKKLIAVVNYAYRNVRYYKSLFDSAGVKPDDIKTIEDLAKIPITQREVLQQLPAGEITANNADLTRCKKILTSGSSGRPLMVYRTRREHNLYDIGWARSFLDNGARIWDRNADYHSYQPIPKRWFEHLGIWRRIIIPTLEAPEKKARMIERARPDIIRANPYELVSLAITIQGEKISGIKPRLVFTMGSLLDQQSRAFIESVLHTTVFDYYGSTELGCVAWECNMRSGYHINIDTVVMEIINEDGVAAGVGERGRLVCTGLVSYMMPFIRYDTGDIGISTDEACPCSRGLPLMRGLEGRADDFLVCANERLLSPTVITYKMKMVPGIRQFRIVQESKTEVKAELVLDESPQSGQSEIVKGVIKGLMGNELDVQVEVVSAIPQDPSGKIRALVSKVNKNNLHYGSADN